MKLAVKMLQNMGFQPQSAYNGAEAVELVVDKSMHFDLVFMGQSTQRNTH
jgi:CheY-like chemotaxis protein